MSSGSKVIVDFIFELAWAGVWARVWLESQYWVSGLVQNCLSEDISHFVQEMSKISMI